MPFISKKARLSLSEDDIKRLSKLAKSRSEKHAAVIRAKLLLAYYDGETVSAIARKLALTRARVDRCINKALSLGIDAALDDLPRPGRPREVSDEAIAWVVDLACSKPTEHGYASELWTYSALSKQVRSNAQKVGYPELQRASKSLVHGILSRHKLRPHRIRYYLEKRDPDFEEKKAQILVVYKQVQQINETAEESPETKKMTTVSLDEKPGIQALETVRPDCPPRADRQSSWGRDTEYVRHGTLSLLSGIDLHTGKVYGIVRERHRSQEFIELLELLHSSYPTDWKLRLVLDNHSVHISKQTRAYLATRPNRFDFVFTPKHGSWLNLIEIFFSKMARSFLRGVRVSSREELRTRIEQYLEEVNQDPVVFRWNYKMEDTTV